MANEILKDEIMSDAELDKVAGGTIAETVKDTQFLHALGILDRAYTASEVQSNPADVGEIIEGALFRECRSDGMAYSIKVNANSANTYAWLPAMEGADSPGGEMTREQFLRSVCYATNNPNFDYSKYL